jgi:hypothetical protein
MSWKNLFLLGVLAALVAAARGLQAQVPAQPGAATPLRVYIDCSYYCDMDFMRSELNWISYMRDRADAQVHVLVTRQGTGGGGSQYTLAFIGLKEFEGRADTLTYTSSSDETEDMLRRGLTRTVALGLVGFVARTPYGQRLAVGVPAEPPPGGPGGPGGPRGPGAPPTEHDPWNFWTFTIGMNGYGNGETSNKQYSLNGSITANRTTENRSEERRVGKECDR